MTHRTVYALFFSSTVHRAHTEASVSFWAIICCAHAEGYTCDHAPKPPPAPPPLSDCSYATHRECDRHRHTCAWCYNEYGLGACFTYEAAGKLPLEKFTCGPGELIA